MRLTRVQVTNFRSVEDSGTFEIGDLTCLVGKNEAGKTAILQALLGVGPFKAFKYDRIRDYPRRYLNRYEERHPSGESEVVKTWWTLDATDLDAVKNAFGEGVLTNQEFSVVTGIGFEGKTRWTLPVSEIKGLEFLSAKYQLDAAERKALKNVEDSKQALSHLEAIPEKSQRQKELIAHLKSLRDSSINLAVIDILAKRMPKFFYTSHFERMSGEVALSKLATDKQQNSVSTSDQIFLDFIEYAGTSIDELQQSKRYEELKAQCEGASNEITDEIFQFWSQNEALSVKIELGEGRPQDPAPFNSGAVAKIRIENQNHRVTVPLSERSAGFVWFFSFLAQFKQLKKNAGNAIILLDEPGLTLHGKAQSDLLRYIQERLLPTHQVIYSTHSPFMVPAERLADVRVVEDVVERDDRGRALVKGTKVSADVLSVDRDTLFPLQGHLGYEITQSLFIGKNTLLVEGPSDILYLSAFSQELKRRGRVGLDSRWVVCPTGGIDKIWPFASLFGGNKLNIAALCDYGAGDKGKIERLRESQILGANQVLTAADFTAKPESDIEDLIGTELYLDIVNAAYGLQGTNVITVSSLDTAASGIVRVVRRVEACFRLMPSAAPAFDHFTPADWLLRNPQALAGSSPGIASALEAFERAFVAVNALVK
jgi:predicted ATP-dependent endonuclease of OLD family